MIFSALFLFISILAVEVIVVGTGALFITSFAWEYASTLGILVSIVFCVGAYTSAILVGLGLGFSVLFRVQSWFKNNLPTTFARSPPMPFSSPGTRRLVEGYTKRYSTIAKAAWFGLSLPSYLVIVVLAISSKGMTEGVAYHYWSLILLVIFSIVLVFWRS